MNSLCASLPKDLPTEKITILCDLCASSKTGGLDFADKGGKRQGTQCPNR